MSAAGLGLLTGAAPAAAVIPAPDSKPILRPAGEALTAPFMSMDDQPARLGLRVAGGTLERAGRGRYDLSLRGVDPRAVRLGGGDARPTATKRVLDGWRPRGSAAQRPHALLGITTGRRKSVSHAVELGRPRVSAGGRKVRFRVRAVDPASSTVPDVTGPLDPGRFGRAILVIHDREPRASGASCGYIGQIDLFAAASQPSAYLGADGQELAVATYPEVFALIGNRFGGDARQTRFDLPDVAAPPGLQYRFCVGGTSPPRQPDGTDGRCAPGSISLQAQPFQPAGWTPAAITAPQGLAYYACAGRQSAGSCFVGQIGLFASASMPNAYLPADGRTLKIAQNEPLYYILETSFGGDGKETFALPELPGPAPGTAYGVCRVGRWPS